MSDGEARRDFVSVDLLLAFVRVERASQYISSRLSAAFGVPLMIEATPDFGVHIVGSEDGEGVDGFKLCDFTLDSALVLSRSGYEDAVIDLDDEDGGDVFQRSVSLLINHLANDVGAFVAGAHARHVARAKAEG